MEEKNPKNSLYFLKRKLLLYFRKGNPEKTFYISGNRIPPKTYYFL